MVGLALAEDPSPRGYEVLTQMEKALTAHENYMLCLPRGSGKSSYCICAALYAVATGAQKYVMIISNNARASSSLLADIWRVLEVPDSPFAQDYPAVVLPFSSARGSFRRRQLYHGRSTDIQKNAGNIVCATLFDSDGNPFATSGSIITCRGIGSGIRGAKHGVLRPSLVLLDDLQDYESANNPAQVEKLLDIIKKDIIPLGGKTRLSILHAATPIAPDDLVERIKKDSSWTTTIYPAIIRYPDDMTLWDQYLRIYQREQVDNTGHAESLAFYRDHKTAMDAGAEVFSPGRYSEQDGHISALQKLLELKAQIGDAAFSSEYMMSPVSVQIALPITPSLVASRISSFRELEIPVENVQFVCASSDLNLSRYITTTICVYMRDQTAVCIWRKFRKCNIPVNVPEQDYYKRVYDLLAEHGRELRALNLPNLHWVIDANGVPFSAVCDFCRNSRQLCGISAAAFLGKASTQFRSYLKSRLKEEVARTLLCGNEDEHRKAGTGRRYTFWDSDYYRERVQKAFLAEVGNLGSLSWYTGGDHAKYAVQVCGEKLIYKRERGDGTTEYRWKPNGPAWDVLDSLAQNMACYASMGYANGSTGNLAAGLARRMIHRKKRIVVV